MNPRNIAYGVGVFVVLVVVCKVAGDPMIAFIHWAQGFGVSHK